MTHGGEMWGKGFNSLCRCALSQPSSKCSLLNIPPLPDSVVASHAGWTPRLGHQAPAGGALDTHLGVSAVPPRGARDSSLVPPTRRGRDGAARTGRLGALRGYTCWLPPPQPPCGFHVRVRKSPFCARSALEQSGCESRGAGAATSPGQF